MRFQLSAVAHATGGELLGPDMTVSGTSIDSREIAKGDLFVPIVAERDGHDFIPAALASGATAYLSTRAAPAGSPAVIVEDTTAALQSLGAAARDRMVGDVIAVTGSVGKTTAKDLLSAALSTSLLTQASRLSFNNELGVPLTLLAAPDDVQVVVCEMGARGLGHITTLCDIARPTVGVVLAVGAAHTEQFGDIEGVAMAKGELPAALPQTATAVLNADDPRVAAMASRTKATVVTFGSSGDVVAEEVSLDSRLRPSFRIVSPWGSARCRLGSAGLHSVGNALAAAAAAMVVGVGVDEVARAFQTAEISPWRMAVSTTPTGLLVINDSYNANPMSMNAAIDALLAVPARRRVAVLGIMAELGNRHNDEHQRIGQRLLAQGIETISIGVPEYGGLQVETAEDALQAIGGLGEGDALLIKASRVAGLERLAAKLG